MGVLNMYDIMLARNVHAYIATKNDVCLKYPPPVVVTPGAESAVYEWPVGVAPSHVYR